MADDIHVLVTGAAGHLGSHLVPALLDAGFRVSGLDTVLPGAPLPRECRFLKADLARPEAYRDLLQREEILVHCASIHPWKPYSDEEFLDSNVKGTWQLYAAAKEAGVNKIVLTSSIAAVGYGDPEDRDWPMTEERECEAVSDLYSLTKRAQEDTARLFSKTAGIRTLALRPPAFMPKGELETGFLLTGAYAVVQDMVAAHVAAVRVLAGLRKPAIAIEDFEAIFTTNALPYTREDAALLGQDGDMRPLARKHWPEAYDWLTEHGYRGGWLPTVYSLEKAKRILDWEPRYNFEQWWAEHGAPSA